MEEMPVSSHSGQICPRQASRSSGRGQGGEHAIQILQGGIAGVGVHMKELDILNLCAVPRV